MKKNRFVNLTALIISIFLAPSVFGAGGDPVVFNDPALKAAVEGALGIIDPTESEMLGLTSLSAASSGISDLTGIGYATNLISLSLGSNQLSSLPAEIGNLTNLTQLRLYFNPLTSVPPEIGNLTNLTWLELYKNQLSSLPVEIGNLINLTKLYLFDNQLSSLPAEIGNLTNLTSLYLGGNQLSSLPAEIWNLTNLTSLGLGDNQLTSVPAEIGNLTNLTSLYLNGNQLSGVPAEIWSLTNLTSLGLDNNQLSSLPSEIGNLTNLTQLYLENNQFGSVPVEIWSLTNLTFLGLENNQLSSLPAEIDNLINLTGLSLSENQLTSLPPEIGNLTELIWLSLSYNQLSSVPSEIWNLTTMQVLYLENNQLSSLPVEIGNLTNLTFLWAHNNQMSSIPSEIGNLINLTQLHLSHNRLSSLPVEIGNLINLRDLRVDYNQLSGVPSEIWNLTNLTALYLSDCQLSILPVEIGNFTNLTDLRVDNNQLNSVPAEIGNLTGLTRLYLNNNQLVSVPVGIGNFTNLIELDLYNNQLTSVPSEIGNMTNLTRLSLGENPLNADFYCRVLPELEIQLPGTSISYDTNLVLPDCSADLWELEAIASGWLDVGCGVADGFCGGADLNHNSVANLYDMAVISRYWLVGRPTEDVGSITDNVFGVNVETFIDHNDPTDPNDSEYEFWFSLKTDTTVRRVKFLSPGGNEFKITKPYNYSETSEGWTENGMNESEPGIYEWEYEGGFNSESSLDAYGDGNYVISVYYENGQKQQTTAWFGVPGTSDPVPQTVQEPAINSFAHGDVLASPVTVAWDACTDPAAEIIWVGINDFALDETIAEYLFNDVNVTELDEPQFLSEGEWEAQVVFGAWYDTPNGDGIDVWIGKFSGSDYNFTVLGEINDHLFEIDVENYLEHYLWAVNPNDVSYGFEIDLVTDETVDRIEFLTPNGNLFEITSAAITFTSVTDGWIGTERYYDPNTGYYEWVYQADFNNSAPLSPYGDGNYVITVYYVNGSSQDTTLWFGVPGTTDAIVQPTQEPNLTSFANGDALVSPVTFTWDECTDTAASTIHFWLENSDTGEEFEEALAVSATTPSGPQNLSLGEWEVGIQFEVWYVGQNSDGIDFEVGKYSESEYEFTVVP